MNRGIWVLTDQWFNPLLSSQNFLAPAKNLRQSRWCEISSNHLITFTGFLYLHPMWISRSPHCIPLRSNISDPQYLFMLHAGLFLLVLIHLVDMQEQKYLSAWYTPYSNDQPDDLIIHQRSINTTSLERSNKKISVEQILIYFRI